MESIIKLAKIAAVLILVTLVGQFVYINIILPSPFRNELKTCIENSQHLADPLAVEIAEGLCLDVYPHFN
ncbi:hypothetical protein HON59_02730 [bacterium]|nr:hypothetical protein [bacterium]MBT3730316.1 hypothetical protein [bacterium]MBT4894946.1 hypothetical protein [bacterium]